ncbi:hypothetical protein [Nonomuraea basaltis]|uniref:hypothetical protein n=1 Tax=Nonomuraea basaltis TaxID=2495887 RepID=UPI00110C55FD|nr:hypothetical protein [Nonomuraea basaltis]TMR93009.1 hypothetical protein EJK15_41610 [Nonomuraea basaltis]
MLNEAARVESLDMLSPFRTRHATRAAVVPLNSLLQTNPRVPRVSLAGFSYGGYMSLVQAARTAISGTYLYESAQPAMVPLTDESRAKVSRPAGP